MDYDEIKTLHVIGEHVCEMEHFMSSFSEQLIFNNYELMELWAHNFLWKESQGYVIHP